MKYTSTKSDSKLHVEQYAAATEVKAKSGRTETTSSEHFYTYTSNSSEDTKYNMNELA